MNEILEDNRKLWKREGMTNFPQAGNPRIRGKVWNEEMMTTFLPSVLLILITYATTFFKPYFFEAALSVNLTTMLVMTTIFMTVMQMLPATAYVKMIDIFLIFGQLYPFSEVVLLTIMEYQREGDGSGEDKEEDEEEEGEKGDAPGLPVKDKKPAADKLYWLRFAGGDLFCLLLYTILFIAEEKLLPGLVLIFMFIYVVVALSFYFTDT